MADLLDIVTATAVTVVRIRGERVVVRGLNAHAIASIAARFPDNVKNLLGAGGLGGDNIMRMIELLGEAIGPIIAAGIGHLGDEKSEKVAGTMLLLEEQVELFTAIIGLTFPNGLTAFLEKLNRVGGAGDAKPVKVRLRKSPSASQPSSDAASLPTMQ